MSNPRISKQTTGPKAPDDSIVYVDLQMNNSTGQAPAAMRRVVTRSQPILGRKGDYYCAIARATFPQFAVWMWAPELRIGQFSFPPLETVYTVTLSYNGVNSPATPMQLIRTRLDSIPPPIDPVSGLLAQPSNDYAAVYDMTVVVQMINTALSTAFTALASLTTLPANAVAPYFTYNSESGLMAINAYPYADWDSSAVTPIELWFGASFISYLAGIQFRVVNDAPALSPTTGGKDLHVILGGLGNDWLDQVAGGPLTSWQAGPGGPAAPASPQNPATALLVAPQQWPGFFVFTALQRIQIIAIGLGGRLEAVDAPLAAINQTAESGTSAVLCDFAPDLSSAGSFQQPLVYTPQSIIPGARFIEMFGDDPLQTFELQVRWTDSLGHSHDVQTLSSQQSASIKLVFVKRELLIGRGSVLSI